MQQLTKRDVDTLVGRLRAGSVEGRKKWSPRSVNHMLGLLVAVLEDQQRQGHVVRNVAKLVDRLPADRPEMKTLTQAEMFQILDHECRDRQLWTLALYGLRRGEIAGLRWENVDLVGKTVTVAENRVAVGSEIVSGSPKSKRSLRTLPMPDEVVEVLKTARKRQLEERMGLGEAYGPGEYVACDEAGEPYHPNLLTFRWGKLLEALKIDHVRLHDARHSCATLMHLRGVPIAVIAAWMGHASAAFTLATYAHSQDEALRAAASSFGRDVTTRDTDSG
ncbi:site-specific integrase [Gordonia sp. 'Campus']|uniref:tyrosine-type recombinase/integrase n=1 Tax=Gordonia sp. 'Campus' TaxID=2915824 RepID=UPI001EE4921A|nr:site-specific integrase [Gordonia sp. 'Campus']